LILEFDKVGFSTSLFSSLTRKSRVNWWTNSGVVKYLISWETSLWTQWQTANRL
jgi:hypothetical protein